MLKGFRQKIFSDGSLLLNKFCGNGSLRNRVISKKVGFVGQSDAQFISRNVPIPDPIKPPLAFQQFAVFTGNQITKDVRIAPLIKSEFVLKNPRDCRLHFGFIDQTAPRDITGIFGQNVGQKLPTNGGICAVRADQQIAGNFAPVLKLCNYATLVLLKTF